jgi:hypothetical protein
MDMKNPPIAMTGKARTRRPPRIIQEKSSIRRPTPFEGARLHQHPHDAYSPAPPGTEAVAGLERLRRASHIAEKELRSRRSVYWADLNRLEVIMGRGILLWLLGIPIPIIILILLFWR